MNPMFLMFFFGSLSIALVLFAIILFGAAFDVGKLNFPDVGRFAVVGSFAALAALAAGVGTFSGLAGLIATLLVGLVVGVAVLGMYLSVLQFNWWIEGQRKLVEILEKDSLTYLDALGQTLKSMSASTPPESDPLARLQAIFGAERNTELNLSHRGVSVATPIIGVVVLVISLAFFAAFVSQLPQILKYVSALQQ